jgi:hypothetical protein
MIARTVHAKFQSRACDLLVEPRARGKVCVAERWAMHAAIIRRTDLRQRVEIGVEAGGVDAE